MRELSSIPLNRYVFNSLGLNVGEASKYQEIMKIHAVLSILLLTQMHVIPQKGENGIESPIISQEPLRFRVDRREINYTSMVEEADFMIVGNVTRVHLTSYVYVTIDIEEYVTNPQNYTQITLSVKNIFLTLSNYSFSHGNVFDVGEKVLVFVEKYGPRFWVLEGEAGKYLVLDEWPSYVNTHSTIINGWRTTPDWKPRSVVYAVFKSTGQGRLNLLPLILVQILFAVLLIPMLFVLLKRRRKLH